MNDFYEDINLVVEYLKYSIGIRDVTDESIIEINTVRGMCPVALKNYIQSRKKGEDGSGNPLTIERIEK